LFIVPGCGVSEGTSLEVIDLWTGKPQPRQVSCCHCVIIIDALLVAKGQP